MIDILCFTGVLHVWIDMADFESVFVSLLELSGRETFIWLSKIIPVHNTFLLVSKWHNTSQHFSFYVQFEGDEGVFSLSTEQMVLVW